MIPDDRNRSAGWEDGHTNAYAVCGERYAMRDERSVRSDERHSGTGPD